AVGRREGGGRAALPALVPRHFRRERVRDGVANGFEAAGEIAAELLRRQRVERFEHPVYGPIVIVEQRCQILVGHGLHSIPSVLGSSLGVCPSRDLDLERRNQKPGTGNPEPGTWNLEPRGCYADKALLITNQRLAGRSARRRMYQGNHSSPYEM